MPAPLTLNRLERGRDLTDAEISTYIADHQGPVRHGTADIGTEIAEQLRDRLAAAGRPDALRAALARAIEGGYADESIDPGLYQNDPVYHAVVFEVRQHRQAATRTPEPPDSASGTVAPWTGEYLPPILDQSQHEDRQVEPPARRIRPQGTITHQHNGWHDHPLVDLGDATAATEPHVHRRRAEPPDSGDGAAQRDREFETMWAFATRWNDMADLVRLMDSTATPHVENPDGTVESYIVPASALNRVLAFANGSKSEATKRALDKFRLRSGSPAPEGGE